MTAYYHGGFAGLNVGDLLLPPKRTGAPSLADHGAGAVCRRDRIYITTERDEAEVFALMAYKGPGDLYRVEPRGALEPDPDHVGPGSYAVQSARIVAVEQRGVDTVAGGITREQAVSLLFTPDGDAPLVIERWLAQQEEAA